MGSDRRALDPEDQLAAHDLRANHVSRQSRGDLIAELLERLCHCLILDPGALNARRPADA